MTRFHYLPPQPGDDGPFDDLGVTSLGAIRSEPMPWLWRRYLGLGMITLLAGEAGTGKSQVAAALSASVTAGALWPDGTEATVRGSVLILGTEDALGHTIRPRFLVAGNVLGRAHVLTVTHDPAVDLARIAAAVERIGDVRLVILDPLATVLGAGHLGTRGRMTALADMAKSYGFSGLGISHLAKGASTRAVERVLGSVAVGAVSRAVFLVGRDPDDAGRRLMIQAKDNLGSARPLAFRIQECTVEDGIETSRVVWEETAPVVPLDAILAAKRPDTAGRSALEEACEFLRSELADGPVLSVDLKRSASECFISPATLRRAIKALGLVKTKLGFEEGWQWELPEERNMLKNKEDEHGSEMSKFQRGDQIRDE